MKKKDELLLNLFAATPKTQWALRVLLHAKQQKSRGRGLAMAFDGIRNPRLALAKACSYLKFFRPAKGQDVLQIIDAAINLANFMGEGVKVTFGRRLITVKPGDKRKTLLVVFDPERSKALADAVMWLGYAKTTDLSCLDYIGHVREEVAKARCTLADIGTSETELEEIQRGINKRSAMDWLKSAQTSSLSCLDYIGHVREEIAKARCTLADIGTSEPKLEEIQRAIHRRSAMSWLKSAKTSDDSGCDYLGYIKEDIAKAGCTLADIGTSEEDFAKIQRDIYRRSAAKWLGYAKTSDDSGCDFLGYIRRDIARAGCTLADIGTSEEDFAKIQRDIYRRSAAKWLGYAKTSNDSGCDFLGYIRRDIARAGCTLADIGTCESNLEEIQRQIYRRSAQKWLEYCRTSKYRSKSMGSYVKRDASKAGCTLADIGTSEEELSRLLISVHF